MQEKSITVTVGDYVVAWLELVPTALIPKPRRKLCRKLCRILGHFDKDGMSVEKGRNVPEITQYENERKNQHSYQTR